MTQQTTAADICTRLVSTVPSTLAVNEAARVMHRSHVGSVIAVEETERGPVPVGILTDRDIVVAVVAKDIAPGTVSVADAMSADLVCAGEHDSLHDVLAQMRRKAVRRLPVTGEHGVLVGVISLDDVIGALAEEVRDVAALMAGAPQRELFRRP